MWENINRGLNVMFPGDLWRFFLLDNQLYEASPRERKMKSKDLKSITWDREG